VLADVIEALTSMLADRDRAIEAMTMLISEQRGGHAALAARVDAIDPPAHTPPLPGYVALKQAAGACGYTCEAVRQWAATGQVTGIKDGGTWRVELTSVMERARR